MLTLDPGNIKGLFRLSRAYASKFYSLPYSLLSLLVSYALCLLLNFYTLANQTGQEDFKNAKETLIKAIKLKPNDLSLREEYESLRKKETAAGGNLRGYPFAFLKFSFLLLN